MTSEMNSKTSGVPGRGSNWGLLAGPILAVLAVLASSGVAYAHDAATYYPAPRWPNGVFEPYFIATGVPDLARVNTSIVNGANAWNALNEPMDFSYQGRSAQSILVNQCPANGHSYVFQRPLDGVGGRAAETYRCSSGGFTNSFVMTFDNEPWYSDTDNPPANNPDRWGMSAHEFGHATGFSGHWDALSTRCGYSSKQLTMCPSQFNGTTWWRTPGDHDIHTFQAAY